MTEKWRFADRNIIFVIWVCILDIFVEETFFCVIMYIKLDSSPNYFKFGEQLRLYNWRKFFEKEIFDKFLEGNWNK